MTLPVTALTAAIVAIMLLITAIDTVRQRLRARAAFGDASDSRLIMASRSHGNLAEHGPIVVIMIALLEMVPVNHMALTGVAIFFLAARTLHIIGIYAPISTRPPLPRLLGVIGTWLTMAVLILWILYLVVTVNG